MSYLSSEWDFPIAKPTAKSWLAERGVRDVRELSAEECENAAVELRAIAATDPLTIDLVAERDEYLREIERKKAAQAAAIADITDGLDYETVDQLAEKHRHAGSFRFFVDDDQLVIEGDSYRLTWPRGADGWTYQKDSSPDWGGGAGYGANQ